MDTEEDLEIKKASRSGHSQTDEGPYYHESWWEAYKGGVKGKLGGVVIGALIGAVIGVAAAAVLAVAGAELAVAGIAIAGFSAAGMLYGAHEFSEVGKVTGAVAAAHEKSEERMKAFENGKFAEIKKEIGELKSLVSGKKPAASAQENRDASPQETAKHTPPHRTKHCDDHCPPKERKWVFWKVAGIGLAIGLAAGALLVAGGFTKELAHAFGYALDPLKSTLGQYAAVMTATGLLGASFGINRDIFRKIFDNTDLWFKGLLTRGREPAQAPQVEKTREKTENKVATIVYSGNADCLQSDTYHRDKLLASAQQALLQLDHTKSLPH